MSNKHTPEPWRVESDTDVLSANGAFVADAHDSRYSVATTVEYQNARLIAAAPDLAAALRPALQEWEFKRETEGGRSGDVTPQWVYDARAALAKAGL